MARSGEDKYIERTLRSLSQGRRMSKAGYAVLLALYFGASWARRFVTSKEGVFMLLQNPIPYGSLTGVFSSLSNFFLIFLVVFYGKTGFYTALAIQAIQFPMIIRQIAVQHSYASLPGLFMGIFTLVAMVLIYHNDRVAKTYQRKLHDEATTDRLSGLPNKFAGTELADGLIGKNERFAVVAVDLNNFKNINNTMGRGTGNQVLKAIGARWREAADRGGSGTRDFITCQGGNEYTITIRDYKTEADILNTISYYNDILEQRLTIEDCDYFITASYGYAEYPTDAANRDTLVTYAYAAMYEAKRMNTSFRVCRFSEEILKMEHTLEMERAIRVALENGGVFFYLQPQYDINHHLSGFEALARMKDEDGNFISPGEFVPVAEKVGLIDKIDRCVFRSSAMFLGDLIRKTGTDVTLSVNVSARHLMKNDFLDEVRDILATCDVPTSQIEIEITESVMIDSAEKALNCINELKAMGVKIAIDDFGTGYSSLSYLSSFPADLLKVDKSFIDKMNTSDASRQYVAAIISIGHIMQYDVITEGVERPEQLETLRGIGCDYIQGFLWGKPMPPEAAEKLVVQSMCA